MVVCYAENTSKSSCIPHLGHLGPRIQPLLKPEMSGKVPWCPGILYDITNKSPPFHGTIETPSGVLTSDR